MPAVQLNVNDLKTIVASYYDCKCDQVEVKGAGVQVLVWMPLPKPKKTDKTEQ